METTKASSFVTSDRVSVLLLENGLALRPEENTPFRFSHPWPRFERRSPPDVLSHDHVATLIRRWRCCVRISRNAF